jgi:hypothetical protein
VPPNLVPPDVEQHWVVEPLFDDDGPIGYAVFGVGDCDGYAYELFRELFSAAVKRTLNSSLRQ